MATPAPAHVAGGGGRKELLIVHRAEPHGRGGGGLCRVGPFDETVPSLPWASCEDGGAEGGGGEVDESLEPRDELDEAPPRPFVSDAPNGKLMRRSIHRRAVPVNNFVLSPPTSAGGVVPPLPVGAAHRVARAAVGAAPPAEEEEDDDAFLRVACRCSLCGVR